MSKEAKDRRREHRLQRSAAPTVRNWDRPGGEAVEGLREDAVVEMGWGKVVFAHTFADDEAVVEAMHDERPGERNIAIYPRDPHVLLARAPQELFLDPSHTYRLLLNEYRPARQKPRGFIVRRLQSHEDAQGTLAIYRKRNMVPVPEEFLWDARTSKTVTHLVAIDSSTGAVIGTMTGIDHFEAFRDPERGSSFWALGVDPAVPQVGIGEALVRHLAESYISRGLSFLDLSVLHDNTAAIRLYEKLGFRRVPAFCIKRKNSYNEPLFVPASQGAKLNPYAELILREARRRGIADHVIDEDEATFSLTFGGRTILCRESLTELTSAVAMMWCVDKRLTRRRLREAGLSVPAQRVAGDADGDVAFLAEYERVVVKPSDGEQGHGVAVDIRTREELERAVAEAGRHGDRVLIEEMVDGEDLRIIVINYEVVAAAVRRPPTITGNGQLSTRKLIEKQNRRRAAATGGESRIPFDDETERCLAAAGHDLDSVPDAGEIVVVRKTANLHAGGTIHDVTDDLHPDLAHAAVDAARALKIPVVGLDFLVPAVDGPEYVVIEANERPGLANHEPQPTAERFLDFLFPESAVPASLEKNEREAPERNPAAKRTE